MQNGNHNTEWHPGWDNLSTPIEPEIAPTLFRLPYTLYRYDKDTQGRYYYRKLEDGSTRHYASITTALKHAQYGPNGMSKYVAEWQMRYGKDGYPWYLRFLADRGTEMHKEIVDYIRTGVVNWQELKNRQRKVCQGYGYIDANNSTLEREWVTFIVRSVAAWIVWEREYQFEAVFAEICVYSDEFMVAGAIDIGGVITYDNKRINVLIDLKSTQSAFHDSQKAQLQAYAILFTDLMGDLFKGNNPFPIHKVFNWAPKESWNRRSEKAPLSDVVKYQFKDQSSPTLEGMGHGGTRKLLNFFKDTWSFPKRLTFVDVDGTFVRGQSDVESIFKAIDVPSGHPLDISV